MSAAHLAILYAVLFAVFFAIGLLVDWFRSRRRRSRRRSTTTLTVSSCAGFAEGLIDIGTGNEEMVIVRHHARVDGTHLEVERLK